MNLLKKFTVTVFLTLITSVHSHIAVADGLIGEATSSENNQMMDTRQSSEIGEKVSNGSYHSPTIIEIQEKIKEAKKDLPSTKGNSDSLDEETKRRLDWINEQEDMIRRLRGYEYHINSGTDPEFLLPANKEQWIKLKATVKSFLAGQRMERYIREIEYKIVRDEYAMELWSQVEKENSAIAERERSQQASIQTNKQQRYETVKSNLVELDKFLNDDNCTYLESGSRYGIDDAICNEARDTFKTLYESETARTINELKINHQSEIDALNIVDDIKTANYQGMKFQDLLAIFLDLPDYKIFFENTVVYGDFILVLKAEGEPSLKWGFVNDYGDLVMKSSNSYNNYKMSVSNEGIRKGQSSIRLLTKHIINVRLRLPERSVFDK